MAIFGNWGMLEMVVNLLKEERMSGVGFVLVVLLAYGGYLWAANSHEGFVKINDFEKKGEEISAEIEGVAEQVRELTETTNRHVEEYRIGSASQAIRDAQRDLLIAQLAGASSDQLEHLQKDIDDAEAYKKCLIDQRPNCRHLLE